MTSREPQIIRVVKDGVAANTYVFPIGTSNGCLLIDPGLDRASIEKILDRTGLIPRAIFCTHGHFDHIGNAEHLARLYHVDIYLHEADARVARSANLTMMALKMPQRIEVPATTVAMAEGPVWEDRPIRVEAIHVPGHTPGSVALVIDGLVGDGLVFTGDTLYRQGVFLGSLPESDHQQLVASVRRLSTMLPERMVVYPGHGRSARFGEIIGSNEPLRELLELSPSPRVRS
jgi:glyoxylase-like metal-dependent hydrolase (beta-lactamase superfamily II)